MNLILFETRAEHYTLSTGDERFEHVRGVLRLGPGDHFTVGVVNGPRGDATIELIEQNRLKITVQWDSNPMPPPPDVQLILAIPRPATARKVLFDATTLGVRSFHFFTADKGDPAYTKSRFWTEEKWRSQVHKGAEQAFTTYLPEVTVSKNLDEAIHQVGEAKQRIALDVYEGIIPFSQHTLSLPIVLAIGGERGWSAKEREFLRWESFQLSTLGARVLRVETAVNAALAVTLAKLGLI